MTGSVNNNLAEGYFKVSVNPWGEGKGDDCLWNIAVGVLAREGNDNPTVQEINDTIEAIKENNNKADGYHIREDNIIYAEQEILVPLEDAIAGIKNEVNTLTSEFDQAKKELQKAYNAINWDNSNVSIKKKSYDEALNYYHNNPNDQGAKSKMEEAKENYRKAVERLNRSKEDIDNKEKVLDEKSEKINALKESLKEYTDEYDSTKNQIDDDLLEVAGYITELDDEAKQLLDDLDDLYKRLNDTKNDVSDNKSNKSAYSEANDLLETSEESGVSDKDNESKQVAASDWKDYYIDPTTGEQVQTDKVNTSDGGRYTNIKYSDGTSVTIDRQAGTVTGTGLDKFNAAASGKAAEGSGDNNTSTGNTNGEYAELISACTSSGADKNVNIVNELKNIVNVNDKTFSEILENLNDTQKKAVATALSSVLDNPSNVGDEDKILINNIQDEINGENGTGSVTSFINDEEYKDNESGLTLAQKWQRYNCCKYFDDDNFATFLKNSGNSGTTYTKDTISKSTEPADFSTIKDYYNLYKSYTDYITAFIGLSTCDGKSLYAYYQNSAGTVDFSDDIDSRSMSSIYNEFDMNSKDIYSSDVLNKFGEGEYYVLEEFIRQCDIILDKLGLSIDNFV